MLCTLLVCALVVPRTDAFAVGVTKKLRYAEGTISLGFLVNSSARLAETSLHKMPHLHSFSQIYRHRDSTNLSVPIGIGFFAGWIVGALIGISIAYALGASEVRYGLAVGLAGAVIGALCGALYISRIDPKSDNLQSNTTRLEEPAIERLHQLGLTAAALSRYEKNLAKLNGNMTDVMHEHVMETRAVDAVAGITERMNTSREEPLGHNEGEFANIQEVLSEGATAAFVSAEAAQANGALITANDVARLAGGVNGSQVRGEDLGPVGDLLVFQGDMVAENQSQLELFQVAAEFGKRIAAGKPWKWCQIKYCIAPDVPQLVKHIFLAAINQYRKAVPCLAFWDVGWKSGMSTSQWWQQACQRAPAIFVQSDPAQGCYSYVGMVESMRSQRLQLQMPGCSSLGTALHEIGHALGMAHEQSRPDRDQYIEVHWGNIQNGMQNQFEIAPNAHIKFNYDPLSIMHYDRFAFAVDPSKPTLDYRELGSHNDLGQRVGLSSYDVAQVVDMYKTESPDCQANALLGMGCIDKPNDHGQDVCNIQSCSGTAADHCCACGGGVKIQCYTGQPCPKPAALPPPPAYECIQDVTHLFPNSGLPCIYRNLCDFDVAFEALGCAHVAHSKAYEVATCQEHYQTKICTAPWDCNARRA
mmetsp:Transcript_27353/g.43806  ORF Transcript_27353/g.43806 Transcript_27353/m.43806 type:complete len:643 (+) Transcript_27353:3-1931(+)